MSYAAIRQLFKGRQRIYRVCQRLMSTEDGDKGYRFLQRQDGVPEVMPDDRDIKGGTQVNMLSEDPSDTTYILKFSSSGFTLKSGLKIDGPCVFFPRSFLSWKISGVEGMNSNSLSLFSTIHPKPDLVVLGMGSFGQKVNPSIIKYFREKKINFEILPTEQAIAMFNFLNAEQRWVVAGMVPPKFVPTIMREDMQARIDWTNATDYLTDDEEEEKVAKLEKEKQMMEIAEKLLLDDTPSEEKEKQLKEIAEQLSLDETPSEKSQKKSFGFPIFKPSFDMSKEKITTKSDIKVVGEKQTAGNKSGNASKDKDSTNKDDSKT